MNYEHLEFTKDDEDYEITNYLEDGLVTTAMSGYSLEVADSPTDTSKSIVKLPAQPNDIVSILDNYSEVTLLTLRSGRIIDRKNVGCKLISIDGILYIEIPDRLPAGTIRAHFNIFIYSNSIYMSDEALPKVSKEFIEKVTPYLVNHSYTSGTPEITYTLTEFLDMYYGSDDDYNTVVRWDISIPEVNKYILRIAMWKQRHELISTIEVTDLDKGDFDKLIAYLKTKKEYIDKLWLPL